MSAERIKEINVKISSLQDEITTLHLKIRKFEQASSLESAKLLESKWFTTNDCVYMAHKAYINKNGYVQISCQIFSYSKDSIVIQWGSMYESSLLGMTEVSFLEASSIMNQALDRVAAFDESRIGWYQR